MTTEVALTPSQTTGPYLEIGLLGGPISSRLVAESHPRAIHIAGVLLDGAGDPVPDGMIETWQANAAGRYAHPADDREEIPLEEGFTGFGRSGTDARRPLRLLPRSSPAASHGWTDGSRRRTSSSASLREAS